MSVTRRMQYEFRPVKACNMCGSTRMRMLGMRLSASQGYTPRKAEGISVPVKKCTACGLVFADPQPVPASLSDHYDVPLGEYWSDASTWTWSPDYFAPEIEEAKELLDFTNGMRALDIGVGTGKAMRSLVEAGFDTWGIEPSGSFRDAAGKLMQVDTERIQLAPVEEATFPEDMFDFVTFKAVLEHLYDPKLALEKAMQWTRPGGIIHAEVPASNHLVAKLANLFFSLRGTNYVTHISPMHSPYHLYEFTEESFKGFNVARSRRASGQIPLLPRILAKPLESIMDWTNTGLFLIVFIRK